jgi:hypothetical protein
MEVCQNLTYNTCDAHVHYRILYLYSVCISLPRFANNRSCLCKDFKIGEVKTMKNPQKPFGSGHFGEWFTDEFGLPAYHYTCNQINDPKAIVPMNYTWRQKADHIHQVGNDRLVGIASNYGHVQVRQDEGSPKFLNDFDPDHLQFAGGVGYLTDGKNALSTYYSGRSESFDRTFGVGYYRKTVREHGLEADQIIFAPFGDDPLLISQVTIKNDRGVPVDLRWIEYWGCQIYQFSFKSAMISIATKLPPMEYRRRLSRRFENENSVIEDDRGLLAVKRFKGPDPADEQSWKLLNQYLATAGKALTGGAVESPVTEAVLEDLSPPPVFLVSLDAPFDDFTDDASSFFGKGGVIAPDGVYKPLARSITARDAEKGLFIERKLHLRSGESRTLYFAFGYLPEGFELDALIAKYERDLPNLLARSSDRWKGNRIQLELDDERWVDRELKWHNYYLRSNLTFDSFFKEHILSQGYVYQYVMGFQGAMRDPLQHALPFIYSEPEIVKNIIRYTLKTMTPEGRIPYGITGSGMYMPSPLRPSDQEMWLLWLTSEYVLATRDLQFLKEEVPTYPVYGPKAGRASVQDLLRICYRHLVEHTGTGKHGLQRLGNGDWNDLVVVGYVPQKERDAVAQARDTFLGGMKESYAQVAESALNAAMASYVLGIYSRLLNYSGDKELAKDAQKRAQEQRDAVHSQWTGRWFKRAWLKEEIGWIGVEEMWLEPQPWAIIGGAADPMQVKTLIQSINQGVREPSKLGATILNKPIKTVVGPPGTGVNGGIWHSICGTLVWALALTNPELAWDEWKKNTLAMRAEIYPDVWYGIWSGPDHYDSEFSNTPGQVSGELLGVKATDFPVMNMHPHAWPLYTVTKLIGLEFTVQGVDLAPALPKKKFKFSTPVIDFEKRGDGYSGKYAPTVAGKWTITLKLNKEDLQRISRVDINGKSDKIVHEGDRIVFQGESTPDKPLRWVLKY